MTTVGVPNHAIRTKGELVANLAGAIRDGSLVPGAKLPSERELGVQYGLSRTVIREALRGLAEIGYIEVHPGRGSFVRAPESADLSKPLVRIATSVGVTSRDLVEAREVIEVAACRAAAERAGREESEALQEALRAHHRAKTLPDRASTDLAFHVAIVESAGNPLLGFMYGSIRAFVLGLMLRSHSDPAVHAVGDPMHEEIYRCIAEGDADGAAAAMQRHIRLALELYGEDLDRPLAEVLAARGIDPDSLV
jgi:DNA-binding FadR family transcriptional regulator